MGPGRRYLLMQIPGAAVVGALFYAAWTWLGAPAWVCFAAFAVWLVKDAVLYPFVRSAYTGEPSRMVGAEKLIGREGTAHDPLDPAGYIRVRAELWHAESADGPIEAGASVRVRSVEGLTLEVVRATDEDGSAS